MKALIRRILDTVSSLILHLGKGYAMVYSFEPPVPSNRPEMASHHLGKSARHFREFFRELWNALRVVLHHTKIPSNSDPALPPVDCEIPALKRLPMRTSHSGKHSYTK